MNQTGNSSQGAGRDPGSPRGHLLPVVYLAVSSLAMFTCVCGMAGNGAVIWLLSLRLRRTPFCVYLLNLAVADLLFLLCMATMLGLETRAPHLAAARAEAYEVVKRMKYFAYTTGLSLLSAISAQRCLCVLFPIWYKSHRPRHLSTSVCILLWALSLLMNVLASVFCSTFWKPDSTRCYAVDVALSALIMGVFTPVMIVSGVTLLVRVRRNALLRRRRPWRLLVVVLASVLVFLVCSLPLGIYWFCLSWVPLPPDAVLMYTCFSRLSSAISSSANPVIYFLVGSQRRQRLEESLKAMLSRALQEEPELDEGETLSTGANEGI